MGRFVPIDVTTIANREKTSEFKVTGGKGYYDGKQCWQYKVVYDRPGTYSFTVPTGVTCMRTVVVGGGGKPTALTIGSCCSAAGGGGGYSEKCMTVLPGNVIGVVVGRQEGTSSITCNTVAVHSATGATCCAPGAGVGGDWNSRGGCGGWTCSFCNGSVSSWCGSCRYLCLATCCGYCVVYTCVNAQTGGTDCCNLLVAGGGSAGSPKRLCGSDATCVCGFLHNGVAGGGAGIGGSMHTAWHYNCCNCICIFNNNGHADHDWPRTPHPGSAQGGGGTIQHPDACCRSWQGECIQGVWLGGNGGPGGDDDEEGQGWVFEWGWHGYCYWPFGVRCSACFRERCQSQNKSPVKQEWWDIQDIKGSGSPGIVAEFHQRFSCMGIARGPRPANAGEGAGTGGIMTYCCSAEMLGQNVGANNGSGGPLINWTKICSLGTTGQCDAAWKMPDALFPNFITCAGTLGGSGGVGWCTFSSKAGKGGGGGQAKCQIICICHGGNFDRCNGSGAAPLLAFPPCLLDQLTSNAGTGMAIIYYREA
jgi:hypothetical protein